MSTARNVGIGVFILGVLCCGCGGITSIFGGVVGVAMMPTSPGDDLYDYPFVLTAEDVAIFAPQFSPQPYNATFNTDSGWDYWMFEYEYSGDMYIYVTGSEHMTESGAREQYDLLMLDEMLDMLDSDIETRNSDSVYFWGDQSSYVTYSLEGFDGGNRFIGRLGNKTYYATWAGVAFNDWSTVDALLGLELMVFEVW